MKGKMAGKKKIKDSESEVPKPLPVAYLKIRTDLFDMLNTGDKYFKESWKSFVSILSFQAARLGSIPRSHNTLTAPLM